ncbi:uncharacterized protein LOC126988487 isoform X2 [Eriocheir sinensis]|uniref:uncharacterized protein LOC126988487 isoform X2 n=1 Tax=Eriocheir sinensis TaxID=95602 RepID=UPI0021C83E01|nr:uncharacterized protein LOC126988487 isoform X2 [Eriocheir sinensis]
MAAPKEYAAWHTYNKRFLAHISTPPSALHPEELKTHLSTLLRDLHFLPVVNAYLDTHLGQVNTESQAHTILTLLDLYSAQEPHRQRYLQQLRQRFVEAFDSYPDLMKPTVSTQFFLDGYDRHLKQMKRDTHALYERVLVPAPDNLDLVSYYDPGRLPSLDLALTRHGLPSPLLVQGGGQAAYHELPGPECNVARYHSAVLPLPTPQPMLRLSESRRGQSGRVDQWRGRSYPQARVKGLLPSRGWSICGRSTKAPPSIPRPFRSLGPDPSTVT